MSELKQESCDTLRWNGTSDRRFQAAVAALPFFLEKIGLHWIDKDHEEPFDYTREDEEPFDYTREDAVTDAVHTADALLKALDEEKSK